MFFPYFLLSSRIINWIYILWFFFLLFFSFSQTGAFAGWRGEAYWGRIIVVDSLSFGLVFRHDTCCISLPFIVFCHDDYDSWCPWLLSLILIPGYCVPPELVQSYYLIITIRLYNRTFSFNVDLDSSSFGLWYSDLLLVSVQAYSAFCLLSLYAVVSLSKVIKTVSGHSG